MALDIISPERDPRKDVTISKFSYITQKLEAITKAVGTECHFCTFEMEVARTSGDLENVIAQS